MYAEMIINIITCVFSVLTYCVRLFGKNIRGVWGGGGGGGGGAKTTTGSRILHHLPSDGWH